MASPHQPSNEPRTGHEYPPIGVPRALHGLVVGIVANIVLVIGLPILMFANRSGLVAMIERETAGSLSGEWTGRVVVFVMVYTIALHLLDVIVLVWLTPKVMRGRQWARITLTICLVIAAVGSLYSATMGGIFVWIAIPTELLHLLMVILLWAPPSVRRHFTAR